LKEIPDHFAEFFRNSTTLNGDTVTNFVYQVGDGNGDHGFWRSPEDDNDSWTRGALSTTNGASDIAAQYAAALALNYINFGNEDDLKYAKALYNFSIKYNTITSAPGFYDSQSLDDDQCWAAGWLYLATEDGYYKNECTSRRPGNIYWYNGWDNGALQANMIYGYITNDWSTARNYLISQCYGTEYKFTNDWGSARYNAELQFCALVATNHNVVDLTDWSRNQMDYLIGNKGVGSAPARCFVVGFADNSVKYPHHRGASGFSSVNEFNSSGGAYGSNGHTLTGALVGGPTDANGSYTDSVKDYQANEVALDYNAGLVGAAAGLYAMYGTGSTVPVEQIPEVKGGVTDPEPSVTGTGTTATKKPIVTTATTSAVITADSIKITVGKTHNYNTDEQWEKWYWRELGVSPKDKVTKVEIEISAVNGDIGVYQGAFGTMPRVGDWMQKDISTNLGSSGVLTWEFSSSESDALNYDDGMLQLGTWCGNSGSFVIDSITIYKESTEEITTTKPETTTQKSETTTTKKSETTTKKSETTTNQSDPTKKKE
ncbi:MAG: glycoside hydrolase family 9 protein, partial [Ruminococcus sp.]|nr:glycoside hydrolase family 9 protein [Ruminococcus sp.]